MSQGKACKDKREAERERDCLIAWTSELSKPSLKDQERKKSYMTVRVKHTKLERERERERERDGDFMKDFDMKFDAKKVSMMSPRLG